MRQIYHHLALEIAPTQAVYYLMCQACIIFMGEMVEAYLEILVPQDGLQVLEQLAGTEWKIV